MKGEKPVGAAEGDMADLDSATFEMQRKYRL